MNYIDRFYNYKVFNRSILQVICFLVIQVLWVNCQAQKTLDIVQTQPVDVVYDLPLVIITTNGINIVDEPKITADIKIIDNGPPSYNMISDPATGYEGKIGIEIRGASSQSFPKKNYGFETRDEMGNESNQSILGMAEENDWILHGPFSDKSLMRNKITFDLARDIMDYASDTRYCEVFINGEYEGVYLMMEKIKRDKNRVDISKLNLDDLEGDEITGGYIIQKDRDNLTTSLDGWKSPYGNNPFYAFHSPNYKNLDALQRTYFQNWITEFEYDMLKPEYETLYKDYIDLESFVDYFLINEFAKHIDAFKLSFYMYKDKDSKGGKLHMGPIWDINLGYGNFDYVCNPNPDGWIYECVSAPFWFYKILDIEEVQQAINCRWIELRKELMSDEKIFETVNANAEQLSEAQYRNFSRWNILGQYIWPNSFVGQTYDAEIGFINDWIEDRLIWMDNNIIGKGSDCTVSTKEDLVHRFQVKLGPNPFSNELKFAFDHTDHEVQITIYNAFGHMVAYNEIKGTSNQWAWEASQQSAGLYYYEIRIDQQVIKGKIIKT